MECFKSSTEWTSACCCAWCCGRRGQSATSAWQWACQHICSCSVSDMHSGCCVPFWLYWCIFTLASCVHMSGACRTHALGIQHVCRASCVWLGRALFCCGTADFDGIALQRQIHCYIWKHTSRLTHWLEGCQQHALCSKFVCFGCVFPIPSPAACMHESLWL